MGNPLMWLGVVYCTVSVAVAVWVGLMLFTRRSGRQCWSERCQNRLRHELGAMQVGRRGTDVGCGR
jgi:uncharacterized protein (DUF2062 family)